MAPGYFLNGISPLGYYGLGGTGAYGSYDTFMPSSLMSGYGMGYGMGMNGSIFGMNALSGYGMGLGGYGMNAMLQYPLLYSQVQAQMENNQLNHAIQMQQGMNRYDVLAHRSSDRALFEKVANNGQVQYGIDNLYQAVLKGDQDAIKHQYDEVRNFILQTYKDELDDLGTEINPLVTANEYIKRIYSTSVSAKTGGVADLETDIVRYGDSPFMNGFLQGVRKGHHKSYTDETLQYCFGRDIDEKAHKDFQQAAGKVAGHGAQVLKSGAVGAGVAVGGTVLVKSIGKFIGSILPGAKANAWAKGIKCFKGLGIATLVGLGVGIIGDIIWQSVGTKESA